MLRKGLVNEDGQSLIHFALIIVMLLAFVSLAVDAGNVFSMRRKLQNAADAAALAAARELCLGHTTTQASTTANTYLIKNGASGIGAISGNSGDTSTIQFANDNTKVVVGAKGTAGLIFGNLINTEQIKVTANANAACGKASSACNLWPIIFSADLWKQIPCGKTIAVWDTNNTNQVECFIGGKYEPNLCKCYNCDPQNLMVDDFLVISDVRRGWVDFPNYGRSALPGRLQGEWQRRQRAELQPGKRLPGEDHAAQVDRRAERRQGERVQGGCRTASAIPCAFLSTATSSTANSQAATTRR